MIKYAIIIDEKTKKCDVGLGTDIEYYKSIGMTEMDVGQDWAGQWYLAGFIPEKTKEEKQKDVRCVRNQYLEQFIDPYQLVIRWETLSEVEQESLREYRTYLLDYTDTPDWWEQNPKTYEEWKESE